MSIASRVSGYWDEKIYPDGFILIEPRVAEKAIGLIINDESEAAEELARLLLMLERGIEAENAPSGPGSSPVTRNTIDMMVEFAYLDSDRYHGTLMEWRERLEGSQVCRLEGSEGEVESCKLQVAGTGNGKTDGRRGLKGSRPSKRKVKRGQATSAKRPAASRRKRP